MIDIKDNPLVHINPSFNDLLTMYFNDNVGWKPTKTELEFLKDCYRINTIRKEYVSRYDFPSFTNEKFRNLAFRLKFCLRKAVNSRPPHYLLDRIRIDNLTIKDTGLGKIKPDFEYELQRLKHQPPFLHDIKLKAQTYGLYDILKNNGATPNKDNKGITINELPVNSNVSADCTVYPNGGLFCHLGCTYHPISYSVRGWLEVTSICSKVETHLQELVNSYFPSTPIPEWVVTHYHFNKDGVIIDSSIHHYSIARLAEHSQNYIKKLENGTHVLRYEEKVSPHKRLDDLTSDAPSEDRYSTSFDVASKLYDDKKLNLP